MSTEHFHIISQYWFQRSQILQLETQDSKCSSKQDGSCTTIFGLAMKVTQCHFCCILLVRYEQPKQAHFQGEGRSVKEFADMFQRYHIAKDFFFYHIRQKIGQVSIATIPRENLLYSVWACSLKGTILNILHALSHFSFNSNNNRNHVHILQMRKLKLRTVNLPNSLNWEAAKRLEAQVWAQSPISSAMARTISW